MSDEEKRDRLRVDLSKLAFAKDGDAAHGGLLKDISSSGASMEFVYPLGRVEHSFKVADNIQLNIDGLQTIKAEIVRASDKRIAVKFTDIDEDEIIALIMAAENEVPMED